MRRLLGSAALLGLAACAPATQAASDCVKAASASAAEAGQAGCGTKWLDANVGVSQLQAVGTHNSYKQAIPPEIMKLIAARNAAAAETLDYSHRPIAEQLDKGARQLELDPYYDPTGGMFSHPKAVEWLKAQGVEAPPYDLSALDKPGLKVLHAADIDYHSTCLAFTDCLQQVRAWSDAHPSHSPILIMINPKHTAISWEGASPVLPFGAEAFEMMEQEIRSVFDVKRIITPDEVRGEKATLREGATGGGWPKLGAARGRVIFAVDDSVEHTAPYREGHDSLKGRLAFINSSEAPDAPEAAYFTMNEPEQDLALIQERVRQGFLVRTRADADTREARANTTARREAALASGAQYVSTDYMWPDERFGPYTAGLPDAAVARCNPVSGPPGCDRKAE